MKHIPMRVLARHVSANVFALLICGVAALDVAAAQCPPEDTCSNGGCAHGTAVTSAGQCGDCPVASVVNTTASGSSDNDCFIGGPGPDTFVSGTAGNDFICGNGGDDHLEGRQNEDIICGGSGDDFIDAGSGDDYVHGGSGNDTIDGNNGDDTIDGGEGNDVLDGGNGNDVVYGGAGDDAVAGGNATDVCIDQPPPTDPSCETSIYAQLARAQVVQSSQTTVFRWHTVAELGTLSYSIVAEGGGQTRAIAEHLPASHSPRGARYEYVASRQSLGATFYLVENMASGASGRLATFAPASEVESNSAHSGSYSLVPHVVPALFPDSGVERPRLLSAAATLRLSVPTGVPVFVRYADLATWAGASEAAVSKFARDGQLLFEHRGLSVPYLPHDSGLLLSVADSADDWRLPARMKVTLGVRGVVAQTVCLSAGASGPTFAMVSQARLEEDVFAATVVPMRPDQDVMHWGVLAAGHRRYDTFGAPLFLPGATAGDVTVRITLRGASTGVHGFDVWLGETFLGDAYFRGTEPMRFELRSSAADISPQMQFDVRMRPKPSYVPAAIAYIDHIEVDYAVSPGDHGGIVIKRDGELIGVQATNDALAEAPIDGSYHWFPENVGEAAYQSPRFLGPVSATAAPLDELADLVVIAPERLAAQANRYAAFHRARGLGVTVAFSEVVLDAFGGGYGTPDAVTHYLRAITNNVGRAPRYLALLGNAHFDLRQASTSEQNETPTRLLATREGLYADDGRQGDLDGDGYPEVFVGRLSGSADQLDVYLDRLEQFTASSSGLNEQAWRWIADRPRDGVSFEEQFRSELGNGVDLISVETGADTAKEALLNARGPIGYLGHGSMDQLGNDAWFTSADATELTNDIPLLFLAGCAVARHEVPDHTSFAEVMLVGAERGPLGVWAPTGVSFSEAGADLAVLLQQELGAPEHVHMGDVLLAVQERSKLDPTQRLGGLVKQLEYLGDPALPLRPLPEPPPPGDAGAAQVDAGMTVADAAVADAAITVTEERDPVLAADHTDPTGSLGGGAGCAMREGPAFPIWVIVAVALCARRRKHA